MNSLGKQKKSWNLDIEKVEYGEANFAGEKE